MTNTIQPKYIALPYLQARLTVAKRVREKLPTRIPWIEGTINSLYQEIAECLVFGLNHSVISNCGGFLEHVLRVALYERITNTKVVVPKENLEDFTADSIWRWLEKYFTLGPLIEEAKEQQIIATDKKSKEWWTSFPQKYRNIYAHYRIYTAVRGETAIEFRTGFSGEVDEVTVDIQRDKKEWAFHKQLKDERIAMNLFCEVTERFAEIVQTMGWRENQQPQGGDWALAEKYKAFFLDNWDKLENQPQFVSVPDDYCVDYWPT